MNNHNQNKTESFPNKLVPLSEGEGVGDEVLNIGIIGTGGFATFAVKSFLKIPGIKIIAVTDVNKKASLQMAKENNAILYDNLNE
ncbi:MAG: Gfo/Idh/MocA family oxidoreductase, partial [Ginsengibacter sp.]